MKNYKLTIDYDGSRYFGWEHQKGNPMTIQGKLETVLSEMTGTKVEVTGTSRTDAGVHARGFVANAHMDTDRSPEEILDYLNQYLPEDIGVTDVRIASDRFHARLNAVGKTYRYTCYIGRLKPVFERKYCYVPDQLPDIDRMRRAAADLIGVHDFASFCGNPKMKKSTVRELYSIDISTEGDFLYMTFHGKGFLQYMVRILTGTLLEVGFGKREPDSMPALLEARNRPSAGFTVPAKGLCLIKVHYNND